MWVVDDLMEDLCILLFHEKRANSLKKKKKIEKEFDNYFNDTKKNKDCVVYSCEY